MVNKYILRRTSNAAARRNGPRHRPWRLHHHPSTSTAPAILLACLLATAIFGVHHLFGGGGGSVRSSRGKLAAGAEHARRDNECWLKGALESGQFKLFSHRSYHDNTQDEQPSCRDSLVKLRDIGVNHLDLDLVLDANRKNGGGGRAPRLVVAHPMEFKRQSEYYSPCADADFDTMVETLKDVYGSDFFVSMEPKAAWGNTPKELEDAALVDLPSSILEALLEKIVQHELDGHCAAIVEINPSARRSDPGELDSERDLLGKILERCLQFRGIRLADDVPASVGEYDLIMPTVEFHPSHPHNAEGKVLPPSVRGKSILWVVDNAEDLALAADLRPFGVVSNSPRNIVDIVKGSSWCSSEAATR